MDNILDSKCMAFAVRIVRFYKFLVHDKKETVISKQMLRSGTSIGANAKEAAYAQSKADMITKLFIAQKECAETEYWLELLYKTEYISKKEYDSIFPQCRELTNIL